MSPPILPWVFDYSVRAPTCGSLLDTQEIVNSPPPFQVPSSVSSLFLFYMKTAIQENPVSKAAESLLQQVLLLAGQWSC